MTAQERAALIARYKTGPGDVADALRAITPAELDWRPTPTEWSAREIVHHLADAEALAAVRLRRLLIEDAPRIAAFDEQVFARQLHYADRPIEPAVLAIEAARATTAQLLEAMTEADWRRAGTHSEIGAYSAERWLEITAAHAHEHAAQVRQNRASWAARRA